MSFLRRRLGIDTEKIPTALWVFVAVSLVWGLIATVASVVSGAPLLLLRLLGVPLTLVITWLILRRSRVAWSFIVFGSVLTIVTLPFSPTPWWSVVLTAFDLCLLVSPPTWRFIWHDRPTSRKPKPEQAVAGPAGLAVPERVDGWYVDPDNPMRMRYWSNAAGEWMGDIKTPRKIRNSGSAGEEV